MTHRVTDGDCGIITFSVCAIFLSHADEPAA
jgi:hypothetical protein